MVASYYLRSSISFRSARFPRSNSDLSAMYTMHPIFPMYSLYP